MSRRENFYRRDPGLALQGMSSMSLEERGVYNTVIDLLYLTWRPLEDDRGYIAGHCRCAVQKLNPILNRLIAAGKLVTFVEDGRAYISNPTFERERAAVKGASKTRSGRAHVEEKSGEVGEKSEGVGKNTALLDIEDEENQRDKPLDKSRVDETRVEKPPTPLKGGLADLLGGDGPDEPVTARRKPKRPIPDGFPTTSDIDLQQLAARAAGADVDMAYQAQRFRNWAEAADHRYADWPKTWANWCLRTIKDAPKRPGLTAAAPTAVDVLDGWRRRVNAFVNGSRFWNPTDWGPEPGRPGCEVPDQVQREFGFTPAQMAGAAA